MAKIAIYNMQGEKKSDKNLSDDMFAVEEKAAVVTQAVLTQQANKRKSIAHTKTRGEVSGGGKKPFRQKGTGRARAGSTRSPLWTGGGITFGPRNERNFSKRLPKKVRSLAIRMLLSQKAKEKKLIILDEFKLDKISSSLVREIFTKLPIEEGKILVVIPAIDLNLEMSMANIPYAKVTKPENISVLNLVNSDYIVISQEALEKLEKIVSGNLKQEKDENSN